MTDRAVRAQAILTAIAYRAVWLVTIELIALGAAGIVAAIDHQAGTSARAELTWAGDEAIRPTIASATTDLATLALDVDRLGVLGRGALAALAASQLDELDRAIGDGGALVIQLRDRAGRLRNTLLAAPGVGPNDELRISADNRGRRSLLLAALDATQGLDVAWARLATGGFAATQLSTLLARHDELITTAIEAGRKGDSKTATARIDQATAALDSADALRDRLRTTSDVTTLNEWLRRNRNYDVALKNLYIASAASPGRINNALREALAAEKAAREQLPGDTSGLIIIMAEIGRGGVNQAVLAIEEARGRLSAALDAATEATDPLTDPSTPAP